MNRSKLVWCGLGWLGLFGAASWGADLRLVPVRASGSHSVVGNEIVLQGAGQRVFLEIFISGWDPDQDGTPALRAFQAAVNSLGYTSGLSGALTPARAACSTAANCLVPFGGACSFNGNPCTQTSQCTFPQFGETCQGALCDFPTGVGGFCNPGFILQNREDYVFKNLDGGDLPAVDLSTPDYRFASAGQTSAMPDPGTARYAGTLVLDVPSGSMGTFTISLFPVPDSLLQDNASQFILPLNPGEAKITVACVTPADCNDNSVCTNDACSAGVCSNTPNYNTVTQCCNPIDHTLTTIDDGNACTNDVCQATTGAVSHDPKAAGTACGSPNTTTCDLPDSCNGAGVCQSNARPAGTPCGSPTVTECDLADACDGAGACASNFVASGSACGDPTSDACTAADTCNGAGACQPNHAPNGTACDDGVFCTVAEQCAGGACAGGTARNCDDGLACTTDSCNEAAGRCDNLLLPDACVIQAVCRSTGALNPANDCQECNPAFTTADWSFRAAGATCNDGDACTGTGRPGVGFDECDGAGTCFGLADPECNDDCPFAIPALEGANFSNNDNRGPDDAEASCQPDSNNDIWFVYIASCNGLVFMSTTGSQFVPSNDSVLSVWDACPQNGGVEIACDDDSGVGLAAALTFTASAGSAYRVRVAGFEANSGDVVLNIAPATDCLIAGTCYPAGAINTANGCEACIPEVSTMAWSSRSEGSACGGGLETECDNPDACDGAGSCEVNHKPDGTACSDDGNVCTFDVCGTGACTHPPVPAGSACGDPTDTECDNPDTCDGASECQANYEPTGLGCGDPSEDQCDHPDQCNGVGLCNDNLEANGAPCDDGDICTGSDACQTGICGGTAIAQAPIVTSLGPRAISVMPRPAGSPAPVALKLTSPDFPCLVKYVTAQGGLVSTPVFRLTDDWGTVTLRSTDVVPSTRYDVVAECGSLTSPVGSATTKRWGDVAGPFTGGAWGPPDGTVDVNDLVAMVDRFGSKPGAPPVPVADLHPCFPNRIIDILDIIQVIDAFGGRPYPCPVPC